MEKDINVPFAEYSLTLSGEYALERTMDGRINYNGHILTIGEEVTVKNGKTRACQIEIVDDGYRMGKYWARIVVQKNGESERKR
jgi:hypothetical protein